jgi:hypothetical protein
MDFNKLKVLCELDGLLLNLISAKIVIDTWVPKSWNCNYSSTYVIVMYHEIEYDQRQEITYQGQIWWVCH